MYPGEFMRVVARRLIPKRCYFFASSVLDRAIAYVVLGPKRYRTLFGPAQGDITRCIKIYDDYPNFHFRPGTQDVAAIVQNLIRNEWGKYRIENVGTILDGGAYIGDTAVYYLKEYSKARVIALEPNPLNFPLLKQNMQPYGTRVDICPIGLWSKDCQLNMSGEFMGGKLSPENDNVASNSTIPCSCVPTILKKYGINGFDIVKLDIEGAELQVITQNSQWLDATRLLVAEFHGPEIARECTEHLLARGFRHTAHRSVQCFYRESV